MHDGDWLLPIPQLLQPPLIFQQTHGQPFEVIYMDQIWPYKTLIYRSFSHRIECTNHAIMQLIYDKTFIDVSGGHTMYQEYHHRTK